MSGKKNRNKNRNNNQQQNTDVSYGVTEEDVTVAVEEETEVETVEVVVEEEAKEQPEYVAPVVKETVAPVVESAPARAREPKAPTFEADVEVVPAKQMVQRGSDLVTSIMLDRIDKHMDYLTGRLGFRNKQERINEQITFMETIGSVLKLDFERFTIVTDQLLEEIKANQKVFSEGLAFRYMKGLESNYPIDAIRAYQTYITFLTRIATNWSERHKLKSMIDLGHVIADLNKVAKSNITQYFNKLTNN